MITSTRRDRARFKSRQDEIDYRLIYGLSFVLFLIAAIGARIIDRFTFSASIFSSERKSVLMTAKSNASSAVAFAFMQ